MTLAELNVKIQADTGNLQKQLDDVKKKLKDTDDVTTKSQKTMGGLVDKFKSLSVAGIGVAAAISGLIVGLKKCVDAAAESEAITVKLNQVLKSTGGVAGVTSDMALDLADSLSKVTTFEDDVIVSAEAMLLTFKNIGKDIFPAATEATLDLATMMGGDLQSAAVMLGKALNDPIQGIGALRRVGVQLEDDQERQVKSFMAINDIASAQKIILGELSSELGGQARAAAETYSGRMMQLQNTIGNVAESLGTLLLPALTKIANTLNTSLNSWTDYINASKGLKETTEKVKGVTEALDLVKVSAKDAGMSVQDFIKKFKDYEGTNDQFISYADIIDNYYKVSEKAVGRSVDSAIKNQKKLTIVTQEELDKQKAIHDKQHIDLEKMGVDYTTKILQQKGNETALLNQAEFQAFEQLKALTTVKQTEKEQIATNIAKYYAEERKRLEYQKAMESAQAILSTVSGMVGQLSSLYSMYYNNKSMQVDNDTYKQTTALDTQYQKDKKFIEDTVLDETEKAAQLKTLDEEYARDKKDIDTKADKEKRKLQRDAAETSKKLAIFETLLSIPQAAFAAFKALAGIPYVGPVLGGIAAAAATALGFAKLALIKNQPLPAAATGGVFNSPYIGGEAGSEIAVPLESSNGQKAIQSFASGMLDAMSQSNDNRATTERAGSQSGGGGGAVYLDGSLVGKWLSKGSDNGAFRINKTVVV
jgi:hypothetical protein